MPWTCPRAQLRAQARDPTVDAITMLAAPRRTLRREVIVLVVLRNIPLSCVLVRIAPHERSRLEPNKTRKSPLMAFSLTLPSPPSQALRRRAFAPLALAGVRERTERQPYLMFGLLCPTSII